MAAQGIDSFFDSELETGPSLEEGNFAALQAERTTKKDYLAAYIYANITSHSQGEILHECPRKFSISKLPKMLSANLAIPNIDFVFGHSVGAGIQTYLVTHNKQQALLATLLAWNADLDFEHPKKKKSSTNATLAVEKFIYEWDLKWSMVWELAWFNNRPATELVFFIDTENGFFHVGHIDAVLRNKIDGRYMILEIKTTALRNIDEAQYGNSNQALGYSIVLDRVVDNLSRSASFEVLYLVYSSTERNYKPIPFTKARSDRAGWIQSLLLDHAAINTYTDISFFPKRGESCWSFGGRCPHYGVCDLPASALGGGIENKGKKLKEIFRWYKAGDQLPEHIDFFFSLSDLTKSILRNQPTQP